MIVCGPKCMSDMFRAMSIVKVGIGAHTVARVWRNADKEHKESDPKVPRQTNPRVLMHCFALSLHPHACMYFFAHCREGVLISVYYVRVRMTVSLV